MLLIKFRHRIKTLAKRGKCTETKRIFLDTSLLSYPIKWCIYKYTLTTTSYSPAPANTNLPRCENIFIRILFNSLWRVLAIFLSTAHHDSHYQMVFGNYIGNIRYSSEMWYLLFYNSNNTHTHKLDTHLISFNSLIELCWYNSLNSRYTYTCKLYFCSRILLFLYIYRNVDEDVF